MSFLGVASILLLVGDRPELEHVPKSCRELSRLVEKCRLDGCNVLKIEDRRARCKEDSTREPKPK